MTGRSSQAGRMGDSSLGTSAEQVSCGAPKPPCSKHCKGGETVGCRWRLKSRENPRMPGSLYRRVGSQGIERNRPDFRPICHLFFSLSHVLKSCQLYTNSRVLDEQRTRPLERRKRSMKHMASLRTGSIGGPWSQGLRQASGHARRRIQSANSRDGARPHEVCSVQVPPSEIP